MAVTINFNTLRQRASQFTKDFEGVTSEKKSDQDFMRFFLAIFGINPNNCLPRSDSKSPANLI